MTIASTSTVVDQTSDAAFRTWVAEIVTMLFTTLGVTQTADTGQINTTTVTRAVVINTAAGYVIGRFNDTAQSTSPVFFKLEFGSGGVQPTNPAMWITVGTGSNGSGTITGTVMARTALGGFGTISSISTPYITRACYSAAAGVLWLNWKQGGTGTATTSLAGFAIFRSADSTGVVTTDSVHLLASGNSATASVSTGTLQVISYLTNTAYNSAAPFNGTGLWFFAPFQLSVTLSGGNIQGLPVYSYTPVLGITPWVSVVLNVEFGINSTQPAALVGATTHTFVNTGGFGGLTQMGIQALSTGTYGVILLYE